MELEEVYIHKDSHELEYSIFQCSYAPKRVAEAEVVNRTFYIIVSLHLQINLFKIWLEGEDKST